MRIDSSRGNYDQTTLNFIVNCRWISTLDLGSNAPDTDARPPDADARAPDNNHDTCAPDTDAGSPECFAHAVAAADTESSCRRSAE